MRKFSEGSGNNMVDMHDLYGDDAEMKTCECSERFDVNVMIETAPHESFCPTCVHTANIEYFCPNCDWDGIIEGIAAYCPHCSSSKLKHMYASAEIERLQQQEMQRR